MPISVTVCFIESYNPSSPLGSRFPNPEFSQEIGYSPMGGCPKMQKSSGGGSEVGRGRSKHLHQNRADTCQTPLRSWRGKGKHLHPLAKTFQKPAAARGEYICISCDPVIGNNQMFTVAAGRYPSIPRGVPGWLWCCPVGPLGPARLRCLWPFGRGARRPVRSAVLGSAGRCG